ncbi:nucleotidyltransferase family protein [Polaribacter tangerinus]|uniref:nucleotidyltransferase family protein n=1 Tax=Polaribacter tangerinus TaxID=1920034 RepID=UPI000B4BBCF4|nr:nucleotidyltransferase family protein [Polaribacter tangerinus]
MKIAILILAAGSSSRMKTPKQLVKINNRYLLDIVLEKTKKIQENDVYCVLGANASLIKSKIVTSAVTLIYNENYKIGLSSSIKKGIEYIENQHKSYNGILIVLGDQPLISEKYMLHMIKIFSENSSKIIGSNYGNKIGVPAIFPVACFKLLKEIKGDEGAGKILQNLTNILLPKETVNLLDIDTPEDLKKIN